MNIIPSSSAEKSFLRIYLRRSLGEEQQAASIGTQRAVNERLARKLALPWAERVEYMDENRPGDDFTRPGLQKLIAEVRQGDVVITYDDSRVGRDALECALWIRELVRHRAARLYYGTTQKEVTAATGIDDVMNVLGGLGAQSELEKIRSRTRDSLRQRTAEGYAANKPPYGYRTSLVDPANPKSMKRIEVDPEAAETVKSIFTRYVGGAGPVAIARQLNSEAVRPPRKNPWSRSTVWDLLRNRAYVEGRGRPAAPIIDEGLWAQVAERTAERSTDKRTTNWSAAKHPLSGVLLCTCKGSMHIKACYGRREADWKRLYYVCGRHISGACGNALHLPAELAEQQIVGFLTNLLPQVEDRVRLGVRAEIKRAAELRTADVDTLTIEIGRLKAEQRRLASAIAATDEPIPELIERMKGNRDTLRRLESNLAIATAPAIDDLAAQRIEGAAVVPLAKLGKLLAGDRAMLRDGVVALFPSGLQLVSDDDGGGDRGPWAAEGEVSIRSVRTPDTVRQPDTARAWIRAFLSVRVMAYILHSGAAHVPASSGGAHSPGAREGRPASAAAGAPVREVHRLSTQSLAGRRHWPSPNPNGLGTSTAPTIRFKWDNDFGALSVRLRCNLPTCSPPWRIRPRPIGGPTETFTLGLPTSWSPAPSPSMTTAPTEQSTRAGPSPAGHSASIAALGFRCFPCRSDGGR